MKASQIVKTIAATTALGIFLAGCSSGDKTNTPSPTNANTGTLANSGAPTVPLSAAPTFGNGSTDIGPTTNQINNFSSSTGQVASQSSVNDVNKHVKHNTTLLKWVIGLGLGGFALAVLVPRLREFANSGNWRDLVMGHSSAKDKNQLSKEIAQEVKKTLDAEHTTDGHVAKTYGAVQKGRDEVAMLDQKTGAAFGITNDNITNTGIQNAGVTAMTGRAVLDKVNNQNKEIVGEVRAADARQAKLQNQNKVSIEKDINTSSDRTNRSLTAVQGTMNQYVEAVHSTEAEFNTQIQQIVSDNQKTKDELVGDIDRAKAYAINKMNEQVLRIDNDIKTASAEQKKALETKKTELEAEITNKTNDIDAKAQRAIVAVEKRTKTIEESIDGPTGLASRLSSAEHRLGQADVKFSQMNEGLAAANRRADALDKSQNLSANDIKTLHTDIAGITADATRLNAVLQGLTKDLGGKADSATVARISDTVNGIEHSVGELDAKIPDLSMKANDAASKREIQDAQASLHELRSQLTEIQSNVKGFQIGQVELRAQLRQQQSMTTAPQAPAVTPSTPNASIQTVDVDSAKDQTIQAQRELLAAKQKESDDQKKEIAQLTAQVNQLQANQTAPKATTTAGSAPVTNAPKAANNSTGGTTTNLLAPPMPTAPQAAAHQ